MKTNLAPDYEAASFSTEAKSILGACVHCGFCTATCPTYLELRDERDSPRGRIYLIKQMLEGGEVSGRTRTHLDRCLTCRSCETTCPSGVKYGRLIDIARGLMDKEIPRSRPERLVRWGLRQVLPRPAVFGSLLKIGQGVRPMLPTPIKNKVPASQKASPWPKNAHKRVMLVLEGCAQKSATPNTNAAAARVLDRLGISLVAAPEAGCCGAVNYHLGAHDEGLHYMRRNIDAWWPAIEEGAEAIVISASGCGAMVKEYGHLLADDPEYAYKARRVTELAQDIGEIIAKEDLSLLKLTASEEPIALHIPCTLQHGMALPNTVRFVLKEAGFTLCDTNENHICCGSAGTYSILQPKMSKRFLKRKIAALEKEAPTRIVTANIGCQLHLQTGTQTPVSHWIELLDSASA